MTGMAMRQGRLLKWTSAHIPQGRKTGQQSESEPTTKLEMCLNVSIPPHQLSAGLKEGRHYHPGRVLTERINTNKGSKTR